MLSQQSIIFIIFLWIPWKKLLCLFFAVMCSRIMRLESMGCLNSLQGGGSRTTIILVKAGRCFLRSLSVMIICVFLGKALKIWTTNSHLITGSPLNMVAVDILQFGVDFKPSKQIMLFHEAFEVANTFPDEWCQMSHLPKQNVYDSNLVPQILNDPQTI